MTLGTEIVIKIGARETILRPSLRRALRLASREGSFPKLIADIEDGSLTAALAIIAPDYPGDDLADKITQAGFDAIADPLLTYILECAGLNSDLDDKAKSTQDTKPVSFGEHLTGLFRIATGWLGWTPTDSWNATPAEIIEAYKGRTEMLKAIFGGSDPEPEDPDTNAKFETVLRSFGTTKIERPQ